MSASVAALIPAELEYTPDGTPWSAAFGDIYHSRSGGLEQARHVFLGGNQLLGEAARWCDQQRFVIVETGFGLGLNFLATWQAWRQQERRPRRLIYIAFEKHPFCRDDLQQLHGQWPELAELATQLHAQWPQLLPGAHRLSLDAEQVVLLLFFGAAESQLPRLRAKVDAFYLDGFAPERNPELWSPRIYSSLARLANTGATLATWSAAGHIRRALRDSGFHIAKRPGFGSKRDMTAGCFHPQRQPAPPPSRREALVIGAGLAGCAISERLCARGWQVHLIDAASAPAQGASGNLSAILRPLPSPDDNLLARITRAGFLQLRRHLQQLALAGQHVHWQACGVLHLARDPVHEASQRELVAQQQPPADYLRYVDLEEARQLAQWPVSNGGWWFAGGGWLQPASLCQANLARCGAQLHGHFNTTIQQLRHVDGQWQALNAHDELIATAPVVILANAQGAPQLLQTLQLDGAAQALSLPLRPARGQLTHLAADQLTPPAAVVCRLGHVTPAIDDCCCVGASFLIDDTGTELRGDDHADNLGRLNYCLPGSRAELSFSPEEVATLPGRAAIRAMTPDRLPLVGALPWPDNATLTTLERLPRLPGLHALLGFGARGLVWSQLAAELLAAQLENEPLPLEADLVAALDPARFMLRHARQPLSMQTVIA